MKKAKIGDEEFEYDDAMWTEVHAKEIRSMKHLGTAILIIGGIASLSFIVIFSLVIVNIFKHY